MRGLTGGTWPVLKGWLNRVFVQVDFLWLSKTRIDSAQSVPALFPNYFYNFLYAPCPSAALSDSLSLSLSLVFMWFSDHVWYRKDAEDGMMFCRSGWHEWVMKADKGNWDVSNHVLAWTFPLAEGHRQTIFVWISTVYYFIFHFITRWIPQRI